MRVSTPIAEPAALAEAQGPARDGGARYRARLIEGDRQGSSGYYSREVIERDGPTTWPQGTAVFMDHPSESERHDRPERSVRDLAGRIDSTPVYESDGLYSNVYLYPWAASIVREMADDIGMSIRAGATVEPSNDRGIRGPIITSLTEGVSVDLVTKAGAGGKLVSLIESARHDPSVHVMTEATSLTATGVPVVEATTDEVRAALNAAASDYGRAYVHDHDPDAGTVFVSLHIDDERSKVWAVPYTYDAPSAVIEWDKAVEVRVTTSYVPTGADSAPTDVPAPAGQSTATESEEIHMATTTIEEATLTSLRSDAERVPTLESERDTAIRERDEAREANARRDRTDTARGVIETQAREAGVTFTALESRGLLTDLPVTESGDLDEAAYTTSVKEAAAEKAEQTGAGHVTGFGQTVTENGGDTYSEAEFDKAFNYTAQEA